MDQERPTLTRYDDRIHYRCPQLGDTSSFSYCRQMNEGLPCRQMYNCWMEQLDVHEYLLDNFTSDELETAFHQPPRGRVATMFDVLNRVLEEKAKAKNMQE